MENSIICTAVFMLVTHSYRNTVKMSQRETKQSNFFVYCENDNERNLSIPILAFFNPVPCERKVGLSEGQSCLLMHTWHFWSIYLLVKISPKDLKYQFLEMEATVFKC